MQISSFIRSVVILWVVCQQTNSFTITRNKKYQGKYSPGEVVSNKDDVNSEPSCEQLKAMWRFSKRQSRAAEITNEIPTYRDPFSYNVWEPYYARSRSMGGMRVGNRYRPVYGRVIHKPPFVREFQKTVRPSTMEEVARSIYGVQSTEPRRRVTVFRLPGGGPPIGLPPQSGSFQHLKELIRTERARELQEQRLAEEAAARNEALREELASSNHRAQANLRDLSYSYDMLDEGREESESLPPGHKTVLAFPNILAPAARFGPDEAGYIEDYSYFRDRPRSHRSLLHSSSFNNDLEGLVL